MAAPDSGWRRGGACRELQALAPFSAARRGGRAVESGLVRSGSSVGTEGYRALSQGRQSRRVQAPPNIPGTWVPSRRPPNSTVAVSSDHSPAPLATSGMFRRASSGTSPRSAFVSLWSRRPREQPCRALFPSESFDDLHACRNLHPMVPPPTAPTPFGASGLQYGRKHTLRAHLAPQRRPVVAPDQWLPAVRATQGLRSRRAPGACPVRRCCSCRACPVSRFGSCPMRIA